MNRPKSADFKAIARYVKDTWFPDLPIVLSNWQKVQDPDVGESQIIYFKITPSFEECGALTLKFLIESMKGVSGVVGDWLILAREGPFACTVNGYGFGWDELDDINDKLSDTRNEITFKFTLERRQGR
jgi:hypothetical protein